MKLNTTKKGIGVAVSQKAAGKENALFPLRDNVSSQRLVVSRQSRILFCWTGRFYLAYFFSLDSDSFYL
jgi:hypothetical protein